MPRRGELIFRFNKWLKKVQKTQLEPLVFPCYSIGKIGCEVMSDLFFDRKHAEDLQRLRGLRLLDDDFMNKVFEDKACAEFLL